jgi:RecB family endonuclease NucS
MDSVEQLTRYLDYLNRDPLLAPVAGVLAAQSIAPQAKILAQTRGIRCVVLDYDSLRGIELDGTVLTDRRPVRGRRTADGRNRPRPALA